MNTLMILLLSLCVFECRNASVLLARVAPRIWGGDDVALDSAPYKAALIMREPWLSLVCGGSIVSKSKILTAAQCVVRVLDGDKLMPSFQAVVGTNQWRTGGIRANFKSYHIHPQWDSSSVKFDVAVLELTEDLEMGKRIGVIGLYYGVVGGDERGFVNGFGMQDGFLLPTYLQSLNVTTLNDQDCKDTIHKMIGEIAPPYRTDVELCTYQPVGHGMCLGDIGNGLISAKENKLIGIASWGFACAFGVPDVFARISAVQVFLKPIIEN